MGLSVAEPQAFVSDDASKTAVEIGLAASAGVVASSVDAVLTVAGRRLATRGRILQDGTVNVAATIVVADSAAAATVQTTVAALEPETMASSLSAALTEAGIESEVTVTTMTATAWMVTPLADKADNQGSAQAPSPEPRHASVASPAHGSNRVLTILTFVLFASVLCPQVST